MSDCTESKAYMIAGFVLPIAASAAAVIVAAVVVV